MDRERDVILKIQDILHGMPGSVCFETDSQPFSVGKQQMLFTVDEFSLEDLFQSEDAFALGWNLVVGTLSDIHAAGGNPLFYAHSMTIPPGWDDQFITEFSRGVRDSLAAVKTVFIGGDTGFGEAWKYTGIGIGQSISPKTRKGATSGDLIYMSGNIGAGNLQAAASIYQQASSANGEAKRQSIKFHHRSEEAAVMRKYASSCIDSSDGTLKALVTLASCNKLGFEAGNLPYLSPALDACRSLDMDKVLLFIGECGEYELVFTVRPEAEQDFLQDAATAGMEFSRIGKMTGDQNYILKDDGREIDFTSFDIHARNFERVELYISEIIQYLKN